MCNEARWCSRDAPQTGKNGEECVKSAVGQTGYAMVQVHVPCELGRVLETTVCGSGRARGGMKKVKKGTQE